MVGDPYNQRQGLVQQYQQATMLGSLGYYNTTQPLYSNGGGFAIGGNLPLKMSFKEKLQKETDEWLKDVFKED